MDDAARIAGLESVDAEGSVRFTVEDGDGRSEAILLREGVADDVVAYENVCPHWTDVRLDEGSGATVRDDEVVCENHGATFEIETGHCTFGPCEGATLTQVEVTVTEGEVYLTDERYSFVALGGDDDDDDDLSSGPRIGFSGS